VIDEGGSGVSIATRPPGRTISAGELMGLPDDGIHRELFRGELRERPMTARNRKHSRIEARIAYLLGLWLEQQPEPRGLIHSGEAGFRLLREPETLVGVEVAYASAELVASTEDSLAFYDGPPVLAVEILSPSDRHEEVVEKVGIYLEVGTVVWVVDPDFRTLTVHRRDHEPETFNTRQELSADPYLSGFRVPVARIFGG
jgi:Uma2 family endonuclease